MTAMTRTLFSALVKGLRIQDLMQAQSLFASWCAGEDTKQCMTCRNSTTIIRFRSLKVNGCLDPVFLHQCRIFSSARDAVPLRVCLNIVHGQDVWPYRQEAAVSMERIDKKSRYFLQSSMAILLPHDQQGKCMRQQQMAWERWTKRDVIRPERHCKYGNY